MTSKKKTKNVKKRKLSQDIPEKQTKQTEVSQSAQSDESGFSQILAGTIKELTT
jgi:hypothetical protein